MHPEIARVDHDHLAARPNLRRDRHRNSERRDIQYVHARAEVHAERGAGLRRARFSRRTGLLFTVRGRFRLQRVPVVLRHRSIVRHRVVSGVRAGRDRHALRQLIFAAHEDADARRGSNLHSAGLVELHDLSALADHDPEDHVALALLRGSLQIMRARGQIQTDALLRPRVVRAQHPAHRQCQQHCRRNSHHRRHAAPLLILIASPGDARVAGYRPHEFTSKNDANSSVLSSRAAEPWPPTAPSQRRSRRRRRACRRSRRCRCARSPAARPCRSSAATPAACGRPRAASPG